MGQVVLTWHDMKCHEGRGVMSRHQTSWGLGALSASIIGMLGIWIAWLNDLASLPVVGWVEATMGIVFVVALCGRRWPKTMLGQRARRLHLVGAWSFRRWLGLFIGLIVLAGFVVSETRAGDRYVKLGSWTAGHGGFFAKSLGTITGEFSVISNWDAGDVGAVRDDGLFAVTAHRHELMIWSVASQEVVCQLRVRGPTSGVKDVIWMDGSAVVLGATDGTAVNIIRIDVSTSAEGATCTPHDVAVASGVKQMCAHDGQLWLARQHNTSLFVSALDVKETPRGNSAAVSKPFGGWSVGLLETDSDLPVSFSTGCDWLVMTRAVKEIEPTDNESSNDTTVNITLDTIHVTDGLRSASTHHIKNPQWFRGVSLALGPKGKRTALFVFPHLWLVEDGKPPIKFALPDRDETIGAGRIVPSYNYGRPEKAVQFTGDGRIVLKISRRTDTWREKDSVLVFDPAKPDPVERYSTHLDGLSDIDISRNGRYLMTTAGDFESHIVRLRAVD